MVLVNLKLQSVSADVHGLSQVEPEHKHGERRRDSCDQSASPNTTCWLEPGPEQIAHLSVSFSANADGFAYSAKGRT